MRTALPAAGMDSLEIALRALDRFGPPSSGVAGSGAEEAAATTELLLEALAPCTLPRAGEKAEEFTLRPKWPVLEDREAGENADTFLSPAAFLGHWIDSSGSMVHVLSTDAFDLRLQARLTRMGRPEVQLCIRPVAFGGGWQCGHSMLDPGLSSVAQLHWVTADGKLSVWVRIDEGPPEEPPTEGPTTDGATEEDDEEAEEDFIERCGGAIDADLEDDEDSSAVDPG